MHGFFLPFKNLIKSERVAIDNEVFRLHYRFTVTLFVVFSAMLTAKQFFGDPITCHARGEKDLQGLITTYCWVHGTYTLRNKVDQVEEADKRFYTADEQRYMKTYGYKNHQMMQAHPGFGTFQESKHEKVYHQYYQWVCLIFFLQALLFYFPRYCWKKIEGGRMKFCTNNMNDPELDPEKREQRVGRLVATYSRFKNQNNSYAMKFFFFEMLNLCNSVLQLFITDKFMGKRFMDYGGRLMDYYSRDWQDFDYQVDPMNEVFPKMAKCDFYQHSTAGQIDGSDAMCLLPLNIVNEKIFLVLWIWMIILISASILTVLCRTIFMLVPNARPFMIWGDASKWEHVTSACKDGQYGDYFLLRQMSKNVDSETFGEFLKSLSKGGLLDSNGNHAGCYSTLKLPQWNNVRKRISTPHIEGQETRGRLEGQGSEETLVTLVGDTGSQGQGAVGNRETLAEDITGKV